MASTKTIKRVPIGSIRPDPNQPRKVFIEDELLKLGQNIQTEGFINPIEVDESGMIITGERRYRASKKVGLKEVDVQIHSGVFDPYTRFRHQVAENEHQSGGRPMSPIDRANAYRHMLELKGYEMPAKTVGGLQFKEGRIGNGISELSREVNVSRTTISEHLKLLYEDAAIQKAIVARYMKKAEGIAYTVLEEIRKAPKEIQGQLRRGVLKGQFKTRDEVKHIVKVANRDIDEGFAEMQRREHNQSKAANAIYNAVSKLGLALRQHASSQMAPGEVSLVNSRLEAIKEKIDRYLINGSLEENYIEAEGL